MSLFMSRSLRLFNVSYHLKSHNLTAFLYCLAFNDCHAVQVLIRSLVS